jgi:Zn-dependent peptidase ImmA (M78 family)
MSMLYPSSDRRNPCLVAAHDTLSRFGYARGEVAPPVSIEAIAEWLGYQVVKLYGVADEFSGLVSTQQKLIGINGNHHRHRQRFSVGHEIAHILLKHPPESRCISKQIAAYNAEADLCASELLIPHSILTEWLARTRNVKALASVFDVSEEAMKVRLRMEARSSALPANRAKTSR